ncbi:hypothetical protein [Archangium sp.]|uniref:hypothetical protein n=1 Tax=Archangium sp. TaxID=1872627 RepID=UPI002ED975FC
MSNLLSALGDTAFVLHAEGQFASLELLEQSKTPEDAITRLSTRIAGLQGDAREEWNRCSERTLDIGIQAGNEPHQVRYRLPASVLALVANIGADVVLTVYGLSADQP